MAKPAPTDEEPSTSCHWTRPGAAGKCGRKVPGIDQQRTCDGCKQLGAPARVDYAVVLGHPIEEQVMTLQNAGLRETPRDPKAEVGQFAVAVVVVPKERTKGEEIAAEQAAADFFKRWR